MEVVDSITYGNVQKMYDRAVLTKTQALHDFENGKFDFAQFQSVIVSMDNTRLECLGILTSVKIQNNSYLLPLELLNRAIVISKAMTALSRLKP